MKKILLILCLILSSSFGATQKDLAKTVLEYIYNNALSRGFKLNSVKQIANLKDTLEDFSFDDKINSIDTKNKTLVFKSGNQIIKVSFDSENQKLSDEILYLFLDIITEERVIAKEKGFLKEKLNKKQVKNIFNNFTKKYFSSLKAGDNISLACPIAIRESTYIVIANGCFIKEVFVESISQFFTDLMNQEELNRYARWIEKKVDKNKTDLSTYKKRENFINTIKY